MGCDTFLYQKVYVELRPWNGNREELIANGWMVSGNDGEWERGGSVRRVIEEVLDKVPPEQEETPKV